MGDRVFYKTSGKTTPAYLAKPRRPGPDAWAKTVAFFRRELKA